MAHQTIPVTELRTGDTLYKGPKVKTITLCSASRKGIPRIHINNTLCYDTIGTVEVEN